MNLSVRSLRIWLGVSIACLVIAILLVVVTYTRIENADWLQQGCAWICLLTGGMNVYNFSKLLRRRRKEEQQ